MILYLLSHAVVVWGVMIECGALICFCFYVYGILCAFLLRMLLCIMIECWSAPLFWFLSMFMVFFVRFCCVCWCSLCIVLFVCFCCVWCCSCYVYVWSICKLTTECRGEGHIYLGESNWATQIPLLHGWMRWEMKKSVL